MSSPHAALGLDIGGTNLKAAVLQLPNRIALEFSIPSRACEGPEGLRAAISEAIHRAKEEGHRFTRIGIGCAGSIDPATGSVRFSPNFKAFRDVPLKEWIDHDHGLPCLVENDANCAVITEWKLGGGKGHKNVVLLTLGTGIGGGLILDGKLFRGSTGTAGEVGHFSIHADGIPCNCGNRGCFERYCSASGLAAKVPDVAAEVIFQPQNRAKYGAIVDEFVSNLSSGLTSLANIFDPDVILLGGGVAAGLGPYWDTVRAAVKKQAFSAVADHVKILPAQFENNSGALGAALLALELSG